MSRLAASRRLLQTGDTLSYKKYFDDFSCLALTNFWEDVSGGITSRADPKVYVVQTATKIIERCLLMTTDPGDLVLDPTCGSGTTAYVAEQWGRRWITCDTSRVALALARTRLMAAKFPYYLLADSPEGRKKSLECGGLPPLSTTAEVQERRSDVSTPSGSERLLKSEGKPSHSKDGGLPPLSTTAEAEGERSAASTPSGPQSLLKSEGEPSHSKEADIRQGFVYKRVPHVTLKSIANNPDIKEGMTRSEIDAAIARHAETETLYDQPYEDKKTVRVSGPFTVESLSPHRTISVEEKIERATVGRDGLKMKVIGPDCFATMILDNLRKAGVQNTIKGERLKFDSLEPFAGEWIHAEGWYTEKSPHPSPPPPTPPTRR